MINRYNNNFSSFGNTPIVRCSNIDKGLENRIYAKVESRNPGFSVKDRIGYALIKDGIEGNTLKNNMEILEPTSGNTGIALAMAGLTLGYRVNIVMPESMSEERKKLIKMLNANLILTPKEKGILGSIEEVNKMNDDNPLKYFIPDQFNNPANPKIHEATTGPEIFRDMDGNIDIFVAGVGTGGTISGVSRFLKKVLNKPMITVAVEPSKSAAITSHYKKEIFKSSPHMIQGIGTGFIPQTLDLDTIDRVEKIEDEDALESARLLFKKEGIICGISSGAALAAAIKVAKDPQYNDKNIIAILPDLGERYVTTALFG